MSMRRFLRAVGFLLVLTYPFLFYLGMGHWHLRVVAASLLAVLTPAFALRYVDRERERPLSLVSIPLTVAGFVLLSALVDDRRFILALPVLVNLVLLAQFLASLFRPRSIVERFARLVQPELSPAEVRYCRSVTWLWVLFFAFNGSVAALLALRGPMSLWAAYTGVFSYVLIGLVFALEFLVRRARFGRFSDRPHDRLLKRLWPRLLLKDGEGND
jgi:uncharacterized membrane protein